MRHIFQVLLVLLLVAIPMSAYSLRCGSRIVVEGDSEFRVLNICGEPAYKETYYTTEQVFNPYGYFTTTENVQYDKWTYNFGSTQFIYLLTFRNGELYKIDTNGYGF